MAFQAKGAADSLGPSSGFYGVKQKLMPENQAILDVYFEGEAKTRAFALRKIGDEWKVEASTQPGVNDNDSTRGPRHGLDRYPPLRERRPSSPSASPATGRVHISLASDQSAFRSFL